MNICIYFNDDILSLLKLNISYISQTYQYLCPAYISISSNPHIKTPKLNNIGNLDCYVTNTVRISVRNNFSMTKYPIPLHMINGIYNNINNDMIEELSIHQNKTCNDYILHNISELNIFKC